MGLFPTPIVLLPIRLVGPFRLLFRRAPRRPTFPAAPPCPPDGAGDVATGERGRVHAESDVNPTLRDRP